MTSLYNPFNIFDLLSFQAIFQLFCFGFIVLGWISNLVLTGAVDSFLLGVGYVPIFENNVFAIITTWNTIINNNYPTHNHHGEPINPRQQLKNDLKTLTLLLNFNFLIDFKFKFNLIVLSFIIEDLLLASLLPVKVYYLFVALMFLRYACHALYTPVMQSMKLYYKSIKDENYLIGIELQNSVEVS